MPVKEREKELVLHYLAETAALRRDLGPKSIVLMQVGSFYEVYALKASDGTLEGGDVEAFAGINCMKVASKGRARDGREILMAGFGVAQVDAYVDRTVAEGYTVAIHDQETNAPGTARSCVGIVSPGTRVSDSSRNVSNTLACLWVRSIKGRGLVPATRIIAGAVLDVNTGQPSMFQAQVEDRHDPVAYDELERQVAVRRPSECIIVHNLGPLGEDLPAFVGCSNCKVHLVEEGGDGRMAKRAENASKQTYQAEALYKFYSDAENIILDCERGYDLGLQALVMLLDFAQYHSGSLTKRLAAPRLDTDPSRLNLGNHSLLQLNLINDSRCSGRLASVEALLNQCVTPMGMRRFTRTLANPTTVVSDLEHSYAAIESFLEDNRWQAYRKGLLGVHDIEKSMRTVQHGRMRPKGVALLLDSVKRIGMVAQGSSNSDRESKVAEAVRRVVSHIEEEFNLEVLGRLEGLSSEELGRRAPADIAVSRLGVAPELDSLVSTCASGLDKLAAVALTLSERVAQTENSSSRGGSGAYVKLHETAKSPPCLLTTARRAKNLASSLEGVAAVSVKYGKEVFDLSTVDIEYRKNGSAKCVITSPFIRELAEGSQQTSERLYSSIRLFWKNAMRRLGEFGPDIQVIAEYAGEVDFFQCCAHVAHKYNYCRPRVEKKGSAFLRASALRHPLIEHLSEREIYVTNDLSLGGSGDRGLLLYGTNAVGKTSLIRAVGLAVVMAQAGLFVPCSSFVFSPYSAVFTRILGNDNIFKGLSTFAVEMAELRTILKASDQNTLVLGDELCSGTESASAVGIFSAGLEELHSRGATFLFATHMHEVTTFEEVKALDGLAVKHLQVRYDEEKDVLVYDRKLKDGPGRARYGLEVCKSLGLPPSFLARAHELRCKYAGGDGSVLDSGTSRYNTKKVGGICESCRQKPATQVHHLRHQAGARKDNGYIGTFHKNHRANLMNVCDMCHDRFHEGNIEHRTARTTGGYVIEPDR